MTYAITLSCNITLLAENNTVLPFPLQLRFSRLDCMSKVTADSRIKNFGGPVSGDEGPAQSTQQRSVVVLVPHSVGRR